jgi:hypothetical protein
LYNEWNRINTTVKYKEQFSKLGRSNP